MMIYTFNGKRIDPHIPQALGERQYPADWCLLATDDDLSRAGIEKHQEPSPPEDYSEDTYYRTEQQEAPYVIYTRNSEAQIFVLLDGRCTQQRQAAYRETDALFFKEQRGEVPVGTWAAAVAEVKSMYPRPEVPNG